MTFGVARDLIGHASRDTGAQPYRTSNRAAPTVLRLGACLILAVALSGCSFIFGRDVERYIEYTVRRGDTLRVIAERFESSVEELREANEIADERALQIGQAIYIPYRGQSLKRSKDDVGSAKLEVDRKSVQTVRLTRARHYVGALLWPVRDGELTSYFGKRWGNFHEGIDLYAPEGTPILAAHDGVVVYSDDRIRGYGNMIVLKGEGLVTVYAHNRKNSVRLGQRVECGDRIALLGQSGRATGPHLHFETRVVNSQQKLAAVDPLVFFPGH